MQNAVNLIFPHQLFAAGPLLDNGYDCYLVEEHLFFRQYRFHKIKIAFHRATMQCYRDYLERKGLKVHYIESIRPESDVRQLAASLIAAGTEAFHYMDPTDDWLEKRIIESTSGAVRHCYDSPLFMNSREELRGYFRKDRKSFFQTAFYKEQRRKRGILMEEDGQPTGGRWTYDTENRKRYPRGSVPPSVWRPAPSRGWRDAVQYVRRHFSDHPGELPEYPLYPLNFEDAETWFRDFLDRRFHHFGAYEDAIQQQEHILHHSVLSPLVNVGLLLPGYILDEAVRYASETGVPVNSTEGFVRQIMGWREFIRGMYECRGRWSRTRNFWGFERAVPPAFYEGTTGILPVDLTIRKVLDTGYCHHIERLMVLGNFLLLCECSPDAVYQWFMELFIDAYDWVMVPNIYGMSQFADGGTFATKPYISGSNYLRKMSDYPRGEWEAVWDGLYWRFIHRHPDFFRQHHRMSMMYHAYRRMPEDKKRAHLAIANQFIRSLEEAAG